MRPVLYLTRYYLKRMISYRWMIPVALLLPVVAGLMRVAMPKTGVSLACVWACPPVCALLAFGWVWMLCSGDHISGLMDGIKSARLSDTQVTASQAAAGAAVFAAQIGILTMIVAIVG